MDMATNQRNTFDEILKTFDVAAYSGATEFDVVQWYFALNYRLYLLEKYKHGGVAECTQLVRDLLSAPLRNELRVVGMPIYDAAVTDLCAGDAWEMREIVESNAEVAKACRDADNGPPPDARVTIDALLFSSYNRLLAARLQKDTAYVEVQLSAPDEVIVRDFTAWLTAIRRDDSFEHAPVRRFSPKELARWAHNRVLPYIDLVIAAKYCGVSLAAHKIGEIIFPDMDLDAAEKIRKTVAPLQRELLSYGMLDALQQAANAAQRSKVWKKN